ncbi:MAG: hypothetical protein L0Y74_07365 [candidate division Zixibacteria bacterium]|nr:hypothetical protein [candidate division Zixibacteria bacterium]
MKKKDFRTEYSESKNSYVLTINGFSLALSFKERDILYVIARKPGLSGYDELVSFLQERGFTGNISRVLKGKLQSVLHAFKKGVFWRTT